MDNKGRNESKKTMLLTLSNRGDSRSRSPRQRSLGSHQRLESHFELDRTKDSNSDKIMEGVSITYIVVGHHAVMWLFD